MEIQILLINNKSSRLPDYLWNQRRHFTNYCHRNWLSKTSVQI